MDKGQAMQLDPTTYYQFLRVALGRMKYLSHQLNADSLFSGIDDNPGGEPIIGIDLGTSNSCCAFARDGKVEVIPSRLGYRTLPSVIALDDRGNISVGHPAYAQMELHPDRAIYGSKRLVGRPFDSPVVQEMRGRFLYPIIPGPDGLAAVAIGERIFRLEEVSGLILAELRHIAEEHLKSSVTRAVITVPAYYNENQRLSVRRAGALAGLKVERILNEPTAASITYGRLRGKKQRVLVFDLGGGTFDVSILELRDNVCEVLATGGDTFLGGVDFDARLADYLLEQYQKKASRDEQIDRYSRFRVLQAAEAAKRELSEARSTQARLSFWSEYLHKPVNTEIKVSRSTLEDLSEPLIERTIGVSLDVLKTARLDPSELEAVLLVGGQTRMPLIHKRIQKAFNREPHKGVHTDEAVAMGAALLGEALGRSGVELLDVLPVPIGTGVPGGEFKKLLPAGNSVNVSRTFALPTFLPNQTTLVLPIFQGVSAKASENELLGHFEVRGIPPGPAGSRVIELTFSLSPECLFQVHARDRDAGPLGMATMITRDQARQTEAGADLQSDDIAILS